MKARMTLATTFLVSAVALTACGTTDDDPGTSPTSEPAPTSAAPSQSGGSISSAQDLVGSWRDDEADWTVTFAADGTFSEDFEGIEGFRTGNYSFDAGTISLEGGDGNTDDGKVDGEKLVFNLGTLERQQ